MEKSEYNSIATKLSSLIDLPEGYHPNLDSKWALLEAAGVVNRKKKKLARVWAYAAALLIISGLVPVIMYNVQDAQLSANDQPAVYRVESKTQSIKSELPVSEITEIKTNRKKATPKIKVVAVEKEKVHGPAIDRAENGTDSLMIAEIEPSPSPEVIKEKKKKPRYVQMDFGTPSFEKQQTPLYYANYPRLNLFGTNPVPEIRKEGQADSRGATIFINF